MTQLSRKDCLLFLRKDFYIFFHRRYFASHLGWLTFINVRIWHHSDIKNLLSGLTALTEMQQKSAIVSLAKSTTNGKRAQAKPSDKLWLFRGPCHVCQASWNLSTLGLSPCGMDMVKCQLFKTDVTHIFIYFNSKCIRTHFQIYLLRKWDVKISSSECIASFLTKEYLKLLIREWERIVGSLRQRFIM